MITIEIGVQRKKFALLALTSLLLFTGCEKKEETVLKSEYDALNSKYNELLSANEHQRKKNI